ncbi:MAG: tRNA (adenosine(37)-N6)-threonylcarbamoyltransferase complex dimerization subunit type 1 TsaB [Novosphingobium sp. 16-62-11]|uniref:tRNA (adenosine(37)-N6)-threonylcarbamoyltransferase complex dimerization subunit type 1 TsaB n=1 Tax=Novosphingobium sp. 17-62-19 TaxID=1970406 RepID=UPI000BD4458D|nr:tRNA (adenosine(37)-N6)-threonylcarbamoyltransferase complex dimerization subunit type 1 TsaB [Novosphingobium sp. 17-62-19]OYX92634.1 MAG: tRNA (adenosine(37)-N6)-threonylcarbamoyltransferase complex dimerization subunit type 1 TsaB [Novosphingobium sp. 35-62-5]OYZ42842.1 MAG: tRNA (adenosine(37)-N6)-threonylcarbamoyltransferase complex dimerization subunit type 1 TsaB [Novosphingobium sp. 16-62-11]OZA70085.1 MAG: tRNA (adenosine(37)-N6)-threonylcarbamoyltransferase complex dimerization subu
MRRLVIDSATEACSVALFEDGELLAGECLTLGRGHAERLVPMIAALPNKGHADVIAVDIGPGSFTGIRVGLAAARALGLAWNARVEGYESLSLVAAMAHDQHPNTAIDVCMTGGHGEWFFQPFAADGEPLAPVISLHPDDACARSNAPLVAGSQAHALAERLGNVAVADLRPDARSYPLLSVARLIADPRPSYGRAPDARLPSAAA